MMVVMLITSSIMFSCGNKNEEKSEVKLEALPISEFDMLMGHIEYTGDFINTKKTPTYITAENLYEILHENILIIDLRKKEDFNSGHIEGAVNVQLANLVKYLEEDIFPSKKDKIILVCYTGQESGYAASALRLLGYANFWNLKYGMSSWNTHFANNHWNKATSNKYYDKIEVTGNEKAEAIDYPKINTGEQCCIEMLEHRVKEIFNEGFEKSVITSDELMNNLDKYYVINYWPEEHYKLGHIPTAIQYTPRESLKREVDLKTLPVDKPIVVYCYTGQTAAYITAYLRIIGYDAYSLKYGVNGIFNQMLIDNDLPGWRAEKSNSFPFVTKE